MTDDSSAAVRDRAIADARIAEQQVAELRGGLQRAADKLAEAAGRLPNLHLILSRELDDAATRARALLTRTAP